jgi:ribosomal protein S18 acetylase RimI-like enzyme
MTPPVVRVRTDQLDELAAMFARAFVDEPDLRAMFPDPRRRAAIVPPWGAVSLHLSYLDGKTMETTPAGNCVIIWIRPGQATSWQSFVRAAPYLWQMLRRASPGDVRRFLTFFTRLETRRHDLLPEPHWFLEALAVDPQRQRFGLGAVLVRHGLARADADHVPAYVETDTEANAVFYSKLGFELVEYVEDYPPMNIPTWRMVHQPL